MSEPQPSEPAVSEPAGVRAGSWGRPDRALPVSGALTRYRVMAYIVGVGLLVLVLAGMPLKYAAGIPSVVGVVGPIHGFLYIIYLGAAYDLARRARFTIWQMAAMVGAGFLPFLAFIIEHKVTARVERELLAPAGAPAPGAATT
ncbi:MAG: DUF3817 domain-containing protein [Acidimicrobiales bacterium]